MTTRMGMGWVFSLVSVATLASTGCAAKFSNDEISAYAGTWAYGSSSLQIFCSDGTVQNSSGSGQVVLSVSTTDPTMVLVAASTLCNATPSLAPQPDGYDLVSSVACPADAGVSSMLTQYHVVVDAHHADTLLFSHTTSSARPSGTTCTTAENGTATKT